MRIIAFIFAGVLVMAIAIALLLSRPRIVARVITPDGVEMRIVQQPDRHDFPWLTTWFIYKNPGDVWRGHLYNYEEYVWWRSRVSLDTNTHTAVFYRAGKKAIVFDWAASSGGPIMKDKPLKSGWTSGSRVED